MIPLAVLHRCQLQLAGDRVLLAHEVFFAPEAAHADLCDAPRTTQAGAETKFVELWADWGVFIGGTLCRGGLVDDAERLKGKTIQNDKLQVVEISGLRDLVWSFHLSHDGTSMTLMEYSRPRLRPIQGPQSTSSNRFKTVKTGLVSIRRWARRGSNPR